MATNIDQLTRAYAAAYMCQYEKHTSASMARRQGISAESARRILNYGVELGLLEYFESNHRPHVIKKVYLLSPTYRNKLHKGWDGLFKEAYEHVIEAKRGNGK